MPLPASLPVLLIDAVLPELLALCERGQNVILKAPPGAGKTTRAPAALLDVTPGKVVVLEPRRLAARLAARRVAAELGEPLGETVGYQVRFEQAGGPHTRLWFVTEGVLTRRLAGGSRLEDTSLVVLDEFHERHLETDFALALLRRLQTTSRPDLKLLIMSATLDVEPLARFLHPAETLECPGRLLDMSIRYRPVSSLPLEQQVAAALADLVREGLDGHVLVFLPGAAEIRRAQQACLALAERACLALLPLHGDLSPEEQDRAVSPSVQRKVILSTNVAESSVTIDGVSAVIDSGLARVAEHSPWSGLPRLQLERVSRFSAIQRAGRASRQRPGRVIRLYPEEDFLRRPEQTPPEILRTDLAPVLLDLAALNETPESMAWLDPPPKEACAAARQLLARLGALHADGRITEKGRKMAAFPLPPRLGALLVEGEARGVGRAAAAVAAVLSAGERLPEEPHPTSDSDLLVLLETGFSRRAHRIFRQLTGKARWEPIAQEEPLLAAVLAAFPDRVAKRLREGELLLAGGAAARLAPESTVRQAPFLVCVEAEERSGQPAPLVRLGSAIRPEWLLDLFPERIVETSELEWNPRLERVEAVSSLRYDQLVLEQSRGAPADAEAAARLLMEKALEAPLDRLLDAEQIAQLRHRWRLLEDLKRLPPWDEAVLRATLAALCAGKRSLEELKQACAEGGFERALRGSLPREAAALLDEQAPARWRLPSGRTFRIWYAAGQPPWLAAPLQEFFGATEPPRIAGGAVKLVLHLLAPNRRPVQVTTDLASFWSRHYPQLRKELARRYPKHSWPEDPLRAQPPAKRK